MLRLLSSIRLLSLTGALLLLAGSASAAPIVYDMTGSVMNMTNQVCNPCSVPVNGTITLDDDGLGNVQLTNITLSHNPYQVGAPAFLGVILERTLIALGAGSVSGSGSTVSSNVAFGLTTLYQEGTNSCVSGILTCASVGQVEGPVPLAANPDPTPTDLGSWIFDGLGNFSASIVYTDVVTPQAALETLVLTGVIVPEPGTAILLGAGLVGLALRRRARA